MKTITSEKTIKSKDFKIKIGTLNKKNPVTMYLEAGTYIKPKEELESYKSEIVEIEKEMKLLAKKAISQLPAIEKDFILVTDVAINRIDKTRGTHYTIQFHFRPKLTDVTILHRTFNQICDNFIERYSGIFPMFKDIIDQHGFECSKTK